MADPILTRRRVLAAAQESTPGDAETLDATDAVFNVFDPDMSPDIAFEERPGQAGFSPLPGVPGARGGSVTFACEIHGSGDGEDPAPAWAKVFLPACGFVESDGVFSPESKPPDMDGANTQTLTIGLYEDGRLRMLRGCMGTFVLVLSSGKIARIEFTFTGIWVDPSDVELLAPDYPTVAPLRFAAGTITLDLWTPRVAEIRIDCGNTVILREDATDESGYSTALITGRRITGSLDPEGVLVVTDDHWSDWLDRNERVLVIALGAGSADGTTFRVDAPCVQITNIPNADRNGIVTDAIEVQFNRSADAGDNEITLTWA